MSLTARMTASIHTLRQGFKFFTTQVKDTMYHLAKIMTESFFGIVNSLQELDRTLKHNTNAILNALGSEDRWKSGEQIRSDELIASLNAFKGHTDSWVEFTHDPAWGEVFWKAVQEDAKDTFDQIYNWAHVSIGQVFEKQIGYIADHSQAFGKMQIEFFEGQRDIETQMKSSYKRTFANLERIIKGILYKEETGKKLGEGKTFLGRPLRYEGQNKSLIQMQKFIDKIYGGAKKGFNAAGKMALGFGKRQAIKGFQTAMGFIKQFFDLGTAPTLTAFGDTLKAIGTILNIVLIPLKPFFFLLELIGKALQAAFAPLQAHIWEEFSDTFVEIMDMIPELQDMVRGWIEDDDLLKDTIEAITSGITTLIDAFVNGDLLRKLYNLSVTLLGLVGVIITPGFIEKMITFAESVGKLAVQLIKLLPVLEAVIKIITTLIDIASDLIGGAKGALGFGSGGGSGTGLTTFLRFLGSLFGFQEGGEVPSTGPIFAHKGETIHKKGVDDELLVLMTEMVYLQKEILKDKLQRHR